MAQKKIDQRNSLFRGNANVLAPAAGDVVGISERIDLATRLKRGEEMRYENTQPQHVGDKIALLLTAFHSVLKPILLERCCVHPRTHVHVKSITRTEWFAGDNIKWCGKIFDNVAGDPAADVIDFSIAFMYIVVQKLIAEAEKAKSGKWQWAGFWLWPYERHELPFLIIRAYIAGASWND